MSTDTVEAQIVLKQQEDGAVIERVLKAVHVTSSSPHDTRCECPLYQKYTETPCDVIQSVSFDGKSKNFLFVNVEDTTSTEMQLKVAVASKDWCPVRTRVDAKEMEGEVMFVRPLLDGHSKFMYSVALFMDPSCGNLKERVDAQKDMYRLPTWYGFDFALLVERRMKLEEMCIKLGYWFDEMSDEMSDEMPIL